jgi:hypothetical protein
MATSSVEILKSACEGKTLRVIITVLKSLARKRLVNIENLRVFVTVNCRV